MSLGGSLIIPNEIDVKFLKEFKKMILKNSKKYNFIIVCGGGSIARKYIHALRSIGVEEKLQNYSGISATRMNARFMNYFFDINPEQGIPQRTRTVKKYIRTQAVIFCGALEYRPNQTSDSTAAWLAKRFKTHLINITNIKGLYDSNPLENKNAKFISEISWKEFNKMANKSKYTPGQHFVLDQTAARIILEHKIPTYIVGKSSKEINNILNNKKFTGTIIKN